MCLNDREIASVEQLNPVISETSLLVSVRAEQNIIQEANSSTEAFNGTKDKFEPLIASV